MAQVLEGLRIQSIRMSAAEPPAGGAGPGSYPAIIVRGDALDRLRTAPPGSAGSVGVLVGNAAPSTNFVLVTAHLEADTAGSGSSTFGAAQIDLLTRLVASVYPGQRIVGWYRVRAEGGVFLDADDIELQRTSFANAWHIGYVHDTASGDGAFFGWSNGEIVRVPRWEVTSVESATGADLPVTMIADEPLVEDEPAVAWGDDGADGRDVGGDEAGNDDADNDAGADHLAEPAWASDVVDEPAVPILPPQTSSVFTDADVPAANEVAAYDSVTPAKKRPSKALIAVVIGAVAAIVITALALSSGDDDKGTTATTDSTVSDSVVVETDAPDTSTSVGVTNPTSSSDDSTTTTTTAAATPGTDTQVTDAPPVSIDLPATPTAPTPAAARAGQAAAPCEQTADNEYAPLTDCHVPLPNGNVLLFVEGSLRCTEPDGRVLANEAQTFSVGVGDPLAIVADGALVPKCSDVTYARNVLAAGADTLDGLCGSSGTQINEATARCFGYNPSTGAIGAVMRGVGNINALVASCTPATGDVVRSNLDWSDTAVSTMWKVDSVSFDAASGQLVASASRNGATATASFACA